MEALYTRFSRSEFDEQGRLTTFSIQCPENFNFACDVVDEIAEKEPDKTALVWCNTQGEEKLFTFGEMSRLSKQAANYLKNRGIGKGDKVMLLLKRHYEYWYILLALHRLGAIAVPATYLLCPEDIVYRAQSANIRTIICAEDEAVTGHVLSAKEQCPVITKLFTVRADCEGFERLDSGMQSESDEFGRADTKSTDPFILYFTSGTTGYPKAVVHDYSYPLAHIMTAKYWQNVENGGLHLSVADTGWGKASWGKIYGQWLCGCAVMVYDFDKFDADALMKVAAGHGVTSFCAPPTVYRFLVKSGLKRYDFSTIKYVTTAGEALNPEIIKRFYEHTGMEIREGYGQTETVMLIANLCGYPSKRGSMGIASPLFKLKVVDTDGTEKKTGEVGEIVVVPTDERKYGLCIGYDSDEGALIRAWKHGVYHTGDMAWCDEDGYFWYVGRIDDVIKSSGYRIGPFEVESVIIQHPAVMECAVTGVPDPERGYVVKASIVLQKGYEGTAALAKEIQNFVKNATAPYKYPRIIDFVEQLPKTISGKIQHAVIRKTDFQKCT